MVAKFLDDNNKAPGPRLSNDVGDSNENGKKKPR